MTQRLYNVGYHATWEQSPQIVQPHRHMRVMGYIYGITQVPPPRRFKAWGAWLLEADFKSDHLAGERKEDEDN